METREKELIDITMLNAVIYITITAAIIFMLFLMLSSGMIKQVQFISFALLMLFTFFLIAFLIIFFRKYRRYEKGK